jgi:hypothetical protein
MNALLEMVRSFWRLPFYGLKWALGACIVLFIALWLLPMPGCARHARTTIKTNLFTAVPQERSPITATRKEAIRPARVKEPAPVQRQEEVQMATAAGAEPDERKEDVAIIFASVIMGISGLITLVSFPVYLFSGDKERSKKAGGTFKTAFSFLLTTGGGLMAYLGFAA